MNTVPPLIQINDLSVLGRLGRRGQKAKCFMTRLLTVVILLIAAVPLRAQPQQPDVATLKADARRIVGIIGGDKAKTKTYCQFLKLSTDLDRADQEKHREKKALFSKMAQLLKKLGPEFIGVFDGIADVEPNSPHGREIASIIGSLNETCEN